MNHLCLGSFKGSNLIINQEKYNDYLSKYESVDGSICTVRAVIRDESGRILQYHNAKLNEFYLPGGKVDKGETLEQALYRELKEELGIEVVDSYYLFALRYIGNMKKIAYFFVIDEYKGTPINHDSYLMDMYRAKIVESNNELGFAVSIEGTITDDVQDIMHSYRGLYHILTVAHLMSDDYIQSPIRSYDQSKIDVAKHYYLYLDQEKKEYCFDNIV